MLDFTSSIALDMYDVVEAERRIRFDAGKWRRILREMKQADKLALSEGLSTSEGGEGAPPQNRPTGLDGIRGA